MDGDEVEDCTDDGTTAEVEGVPAPAKLPKYLRPASPAPGYHLPRLNAGHRRRAFHQFAPDDED